VATRSAAAISAEALSGRGAVGPATADDAVALRMLRMSNSAIVALGYADGGASSGAAPLSLLKDRGAKVVKELQKSVSAIDETWT
jgi:hypothetical protein